MSTWFQINSLSPNSDQHQISHHISVLFTQCYCKGVAVHIIIFEGSKTELIKIYEEVWVWGRMRKDPLSPNINMHFLIIVLQKFLMVVVGSFYTNIKTFHVWWSLNWWSPTDQLLLNNNNYVIYYWLPNFGDYSNDLEVYNYLLFFS